MSKLLDMWSTWTAPASGSMVHTDDKPAVDALRPSKVAPVRTWDEYVRSANFGEDEKQLHVGLRPIPYLGNVRQAKAIVLLQNPGLAPSDLHAESKGGDFVDRLQENLSGHGCRGDYPFLFLDPNFAWHGGFTWWHKKLMPVIRKVASELNTDLRTARQAVARHVAAIELLPYHSKTGVLTLAELKLFLSVVHARSHVRDLLESDADVQIIATRHLRQWDLLDDFDGHDRCCKYDSTQAMSATLNPDHGNGGGQRIVKAVVDAVRAGG